jgi:hypothetical protein
MGTTLALDTGPKKKLRQVSSSHHQEHDGSIGQFNGDMTTQSGIQYRIMEMGQCTLKSVWLQYTVSHYGNGAVHFEVHMVTVYSITICLFNNDDRNRQNVYHDTFFLNCTDPEHAGSIL